jgi:hypothetical protein
MGVQMKYLIALGYLVVIANLATAQKPKNGIYTYNIIWDEFGGKDLQNTCTVIINNDSIKIIHNGSSNLTGKKGDVFIQGIILRHKSGKWIIGQSIKDKHAPETGACVDGPTEIDFKRKVVWLC